MCAVVKAAPDGVSKALKRPHDVTATKRGAVHPALPSQNEEEMKKKRRKHVSRIPLPRQIGGAHRPRKGKGSYRRKKRKNGLN